MEPNKILSASILDLIFDDRNKEYGAYELRKTYSKRITKALLITASIGVLAFTGAALANSLRPNDEGRLIIKDVTLEDIKQDEKPEPLPEIKKPEPPPRVQTEKLTTMFTVVPDEKADEPPPTTDDLQDAKIDFAKNAGVPDEGIAAPNEIDKKGIIEARKNDESDEPFRSVEVDAKFTGNWEKFLTKNLSAEVPVDNDAPIGTYRVLIQFVVDLEGNVSDIKALTNFGYGMEQEAIRVLKKATRWVPANQNGRPVKAYRTQPITFQVLGQ